jgi:uncharacterized protein (TIRG00374 family)
MGSFRQSNGAYFAIAHMVLSAAMSKHAIRIVVSLVLAAALLAIFLWNLDLEEVGRSLASADSGLVATSVMMGLLAYWLRVVRWQMILRPAGKTRHSSAVIATLVGYAAITLIPARMGDLIRPLILSKRDRLPASATLASILTERIFDLWTVIAFFLIFLIFPPELPMLSAKGQDYLGILSTTGMVLGAGLVAGTLVLLGLFRFQERFVELITRPVAWVREGWRQPIATFLNHFLDGLRVLQRPRDLVLTLVFSILTWMTIFFQIQLMLRAFGVDTPLRAAFLLVILTVMGMAIPTPGGVGGFHAMMQLGLQHFLGVAANTGGAIAIAHHAACFLPITILGLACLPLFGLSLRDPAPQQTAEGRAG